MNTISFNLGFILIFALIVWFFLINDFYLKVFFLKKNKKRRKNDTNEVDIFEQAYGGKTVPLYIKKAILKSQDTYKLLSLYLASKNFIDFQVYQIMMKSNSNNYIEEYVNYLLSLGLEGKVYVFFKILKWVALVGFFIQVGVFYNDLHAYSENQVNIINFIFYYVLFIIIFIALMPNQIFFKSMTCNRVMGVGIFVCVVWFAFFNTYGMFFQFKNLVESKPYIVILINMLLVLLGAYMCLEYKKLNYMVDFFVLLKENLKEETIDTETN